MLQACCLITLKFTHKKDEKINQISKFQMNIHCLHGAFIYMKNISQGYGINFQWK